ncbi:HNH endonuclease signature motif containing protein [Shewanella sp. 1_MG-2023]|uniref:HNH endonuclease n=1 Tax=unclassified Shewanella TaxID=196818 RepID=UPI0026E308F9|nr:MULTISPECIES: HNH endonuclease signature motif containing protein [unclassified Shewanella]MDO6612275.1 HNH endonuclease signature motif containing protein [Shewanella sp. 7_MG-2023]MDO6772129.1 HNH endonuclease signature motif containing protein [Shewanella sp. 2_MG-2023]MDO6794035.1 HNH endonuclease signature motif containing protein [Shewanella sp. 1_MG-2023]
MSKYTSEQLSSLAKLSFNLYIEKYKESSNLQYSITPKSNKMKIHLIANDIGMSTGTAEIYSERLFNLFNELNEFNLNNGLPPCQGDLRTSGLQVFDKKHFIKQAIPNESSYDDELIKRIKNSNKLSHEDRLKELEESSRLPEKIEVTTYRFIRNANVIVEVLTRANGTCENCNSEAPFLRSKNRTPYLEVHHVIKLADGGEDTVDNVIAVCPNCHRQLHFG